MLDHNPNMCTGKASVEESMMGIRYMPCVKYRGCMWHYEYMFMNHKGQPYLNYTYCPNRSRKYTLAELAWRRAQMVIRWLPFVKSHDCTWHLVYFINHKGQPYLNYTYCANRSRKYTLAELSWRRAQLVIRWLPFVKSHDCTWHLGNCECLYGDCHVSRTMLVYDCFEVFLMYIASIWVQ